MYRVLTERSAHLMTREFDVQEDVGNGNSSSTASHAEESEPSGLKYKELEKV